MAAILEVVPLPAPIRRRWTNESAGRRLSQSGISVSLAAYAGIRWLALWIGVGMSVLLVASEANLVHEFMGLVCLAVALFGPDAWLGLRIRRRRSEIDLALPDFLDRLALGLEAGLGFSVAFRRTSANFRGLLGDEMKMEITVMHALEIWIPVISTIVIAFFGFLLKEIRNIKLNLTSVNTTLKFLTENGIIRMQNDLAQRVSRLEGQRDNDKKRPE